ncbi:MAG TPA: HIT domain-containing protein [Burkholderiales bacterium]|nr:HIT domain-containing protein [Burkholderiaceae bacterium]HQR53168.1 HIT domain-containing protein [Burkholderiales bacterium]
MNGAPAECPFCALPLERIERQNSLALSFFDAYPVSDGHALVIPRRHLASAGDLTEAEVVAIWQLLRQMREIVHERHRPDGFNIGVNDGAVAGQTVGHAHFHLIPRYAGDLPDPRGGVRWVLPGKAKYWE